MQNTRIRLEVPLPAYPDELHEVLGYAFQQARYDVSSEVADYIPELAKANPDHFGLAVAAAHGRLYQFGDAFNAIEFDPRTRRPYNPMVSAGAITVAALLHNHLGTGAFDFILDGLQPAAGRQLDVDESGVGPGSYPRTNQALSGPSVGPCVGRS